MKSIITKIFFGILLIGTLGCESFLDAGAPKDQMPSDLAFSDNKTATASVTGVLSRMNQLNYQFANVLALILPGMAADELVYFASSAPYDEFKDNHVLSSNSNVRTLWTQPYSYIAQMNIAIEGLENATGLSAEVRNQLRGEAHFIRAFNYFYLVNYFGGVPLVLGTDVMANNTLPRASESEVFDAIIDDLKLAKDLLYPDYPSGAEADAGGERIRANRAAASALLARAYLYTGQWRLAEDEASAVLADPLYRLLPEEKIADVFHANSDEAIWQLQAVNTAGGRNTWEGFLMVPASPTGTPLIQLVPGLVNAFEPGDARYNNWVRNSPTANADRFYPFKYQARFGVTPIEEYTMVLRLAEQYLIRAEARLNQQNFSGALSDINAIRIRAGLGALSLGDDEQAIRLALEQERRIELFAEWGHRWFDLRRWESISGDPSKTRADDVLAPVKTDWQSNDIYWPLPDVATQTNPNLNPN